MAVLKVDCKGEEHESMKTVQQEMLRPESQTVANDEVSL